MRSAIDRDADPQQMIPKLTCLLLKTGQAEFSELVQLRDGLSRLRHVGAVRNQSQLAA